VALRDILALAAADDAWDREVDTRQIALAREPGGCVLGSRLAIWMLPDADLKVYLRARPETRARRIHLREGGGIDDIAAFTEARDAQDRERYRRIYGIDNDDYAFAGLIIESDELRPEEITAMIVAEIAARRQREDP